VQRGAGVLSLYFSNLAGEVNETYGDNVRCPVCPSLQEEWRRVSLLLASSHRQSQPCCRRGVCGRQVKPTHVGEACVEVPSLSNRVLPQVLSASVSMLGKEASKGERKCVFMESEVA